MKAIHLATLTALAAVSAWASSPVVSNVSLEQKSAKRAEITYTLSEDAVVTLDIVTNAPGGGWASIGAENVVKVWGDVNKLVTGAGTHTLYWAPDASWLDQTGFGSEVKARVKAWATDAPPPYMVIDLEIASRGGSVPADFIRYYETANQLPDGGLASDIYRTERLVMRRIPAKGVTWRMGAPTTERWREWGNGGKETPHYVTLSEDYYIGVFETTVTQYHQYMGGDTQYSGTLAAINVTYEGLRGENTSYDFPANGHAVASGSKFGILRAKTGGIAFDLPTEAQWEFACRAREGGPFSPAIDMSDLASHINWTANFEAIGWCLGKDDADRTSFERYRVGGKQPNAWGLYDMHGNVYELCLDWYKYDLGSASVTDPSVSVAERTDSKKVCRGGSAHYACQYQCRAAYRYPGKYVNATDNVVGFRLVCPAVAF